MAGSINKVILLGRLGADPEVRVSQEGNKIARFSIATSETWKDKNTNEKKDRTEWHKIVIFSPGLSEIAEKYLKKGSLIYIEGQLRNRKYTDQTGMEKNISEVVLQGYNTNYLRLVLTILQQIKMLHRTLIALMSKTRSLFSII